MSHIQAAKGATLIELLVVITIMMVMLGFVGGGVIDSVDRARAQVELISIHSLIKKANVHAFSSGVGIRLKFESNKTLTLIDGGNLVEKRYEYLYFPDQVLLFNRNGFTNSRAIDVTVRGIKKEIILVPILGR